MDAHLNAQNINSNDKMNKLIIIPCHSIWLNGPTGGLDQQEWLLALFQMEGQDHLCFREHIKLGFEELRKDDQSLLVISGGCTKEQAGRVSEASSYELLAKSIVEDSRSDLWNRVILEEFARDSFENVLFLICKFYETKKIYPEQVTIVGFEFKRDRFVNCHLSGALGYPEKSVTYIGNSPAPPSSANTYFEELLKSEYNHAVKHFQHDLYGTREPLLGKKKSRNPFGLYHSYGETNPDLREFLDCIEDLANPLDDQMVRSKLRVPWLTIEKDKEI